MMSHHLSWKGEGAVENLGAGAFLLILGSWGAESHLSPPGWVHRAVMCSGEAVVSCGIFGLSQTSPRLGAGLFLLPCPSVGWSARAEGCPACCCVTGQQTGLGCLWQVGVPSLLSHPRGN